MAKCVDCGQQYELTQASDRKRVAHPKRIGKTILQALYWPGRFLGKCQPCGAK